MNIELLTLSTVNAIQGEKGNFTVSVTQAPRYVDMDKCIGCNICSEKCPSKAVDTFNEGLVKRRAIYVPYAQAYGHRFEETRRRVPSTLRAKDLLDFEAEVPLEVGLRRTADWFQAQRAGA